MARLLQRPLVPIASIDDAKQTRQALLPYLDEMDSLVSLHVIESGGPSSPASKNQREEIATATQEVMQNLSAVDNENRSRDAQPEVQIETKTLHGGDPVKRILEAATETAATTIAFTPRPGGRIVRFVSGDMTVKLVTNDRHPVVTLPRPEE